MKGIVDQLDRVRGNCAGHETPLPAVGERLGTIRRIAEDERLRAVGIPVGRNEHGWFLACGETNLRARELWRLHAETIRQELAARATIERNPALHEAHVLRVSTYQNLGAIPLEPEIVDVEACTRRRPDDEAKVVAYDDLRFNLRPIGCGGERNRLRFTEVDEAKLQFADGSRGIVVPHPGGDRVVPRLEFLDRLRNLHRRTLVEPPPSTEDRT